MDRTAYIISTDVLINTNYLNPILANARIGAGKARHKGDKMLTNKQIDRLIYLLEDTQAWRENDDIVVALEAMRPPNDKVWDIAEALAVVCDLDMTMNKGILLRNAKILRNAGYTITNLNDIYNVGGPWYQHDWRGKKGQRPAATDIVKTIKGLMNAQPNDMQSRHAARLERFADKETT